MYHITHVFKDLIKFRIFLLYAYKNHSQLYFYLDGITFENFYMLFLFVCMKHFCLNSLINKNLVHL